MSSQNISIILVDNELNALAFKTKQITKIIYWDDVWVSCIDKKSINAHYENQKVLSVLDILNYTANEAIKDETDKKTVFKKINELKKNLTKLNQKIFSYPEVSIRGQGAIPDSIKETPYSTEGIDVDIFSKLANKVPTYSQMDLDREQKSYAAMCNLIKENEKIWVEIDRVFKKCGFSKDTAVARNKKQDKAIYYYQLKGIFPSQEINDKLKNADGIKKHYLKHSYKIDEEGNWANKKDRIFSNLNQLKIDNVKYLHDFTLDSIHGKWFIALQFSQVYARNQIQKGLNSSKIMINKDRFTLGRKLKDLLSNDGLEVFVAAEMEEGRIVKLFSLYENPLINDYVLDANILLEKMRLESSLSFAGEKPIIKTKNARI